MVERIPHRDLRNDSSRILREVASGATYEITNHGEVVAVISPPHVARPLRVRPATRHGGWHELRRHRVEESVEQMLDVLRGEG